MKIRNFFSKRIFQFCSENKIVDIQPVPTISIEALEAHVTNNDLKQFNEEITKQFSISTELNLKCQVQILKKIMKLSRVEIGNDYFEVLKKHGHGKNDIFYSHLIQLNAIYGSYPQAFTYIIQSYLNDIHLDHEVFRLMIDRSASEDVSYLNMIYQIYKEKFELTKGISECLLESIHSTSNFELKKIVQKEMIEKNIIVAIEEKPLTTVIEPKKAGRNIKKLKEKKRSNFNKVFKITSQDIKKIEKMFFIDQEENEEEDQDGTEDSTGERSNSSELDSDDQSNSESSSSESDSDKK